VEVVRQMLGLARETSLRAYRHALQEQ
jgi:hypothetical protein